ncbi:MAG: hypothetical protein PUA95_06030, partial [Lactimicrobium massiliense]
CIDIRPADRIADSEECFSIRNQKYGIIQSLAQKQSTMEAVRIYIQEQGKRDNEGYRRHAGRRKAANPA